MLLGSGPAEDGQDAVGLSEVLLELDGWRWWWVVESTSLVALLTPLAVTLSVPSDGIVSFPGG